MSSASAAGQSGAPGHVLLLDSDRDITELATAILTDEGFAVSTLAQQTGPEFFSRLINQLEPDCVLLDHGGRSDYAESWELAALLTARSRPIPVIMFTAHSSAVVEARTHESSRSLAAGFAGIVENPFDLDTLLVVVAEAVGHAIPFNHSAAGDRARTDELVSRLEAGGATDIRHSGRREWVTFRSPADQLIQLYWWQQQGVYLVGRYGAEAADLEPIGRFTDRQAAIACALRG
jgi:CheY-like chemotaxis protein